MANDLNLGRQRANLASIRVEGGNPGSLDYSTSALNNLATLPPTKWCWSCVVPENVHNPLLPPPPKKKEVIGNSRIWWGGGCQKPKSLRKWMKLNNTAFTEGGGGSQGEFPSIGVYEYFLEPHNETNDHQMYQQFRQVSCCVANDQSNSTIILNYS